MQNVNQICKPENQKEEKITIVLYMIDIQLIMCKQEIENVLITVDLKSFGYGFKSRFEYKRFNAEVAQLVEHNLAKVRVAGSSPVFCSCFHKSHDSL